MDIAQNLTKGGENKTLLKFSLPVIAATVIQLLFNMTDVIIIGHFKGAAYSAGVGIGGQLCYLVINGAIGVGMGATVYIGKVFAEENKEKEIKKVIFNAFLLFLLLSIILGACGIILAKPFLMLINTPPESLKIALNYTRVNMAGLFFVFTFTLVSSVIRGLGNSKLPLIIIFIAFIIHIILDFLFVGVLGWSEISLAVATIVSEGLAALVGIVILFKKEKKFMPRKADFKFNKIVIGKIIKLGFPIAILNIGATLSFLLLQFIGNSASYGNSLDNAAASAINIRYNGMVVLPTRAMASAVAAITAQNIGGGKEVRGRKTMLYALLYTLIGGLVFSVLTFFFPKEIIFILGGKEGVQEAGKIFMQAMSPDYVILPLAVILYGVVEGYHKPKVSMTVNLIASLIIRVPLAYLFTKLFPEKGLLGLGLSIPLASLSAAVMMWIYCLSSKTIRKLFLKGNKKAVFKKQNET